MRRRYTITVNFYALILAIAACGCLYLIYLYYNAETEIAKVYIFGASLLTVFIGLLGLLYTLYQREEQTSQRRREFSLHLIEKWNEPDFSMLAADASAVLLKAKAVDGADKKRAVIREFDGGQRSVVSVLNHLEYVHISIVRGVADENVLLLFFHTIVGWYWHHTDTWIEALRREEKNYRIYREFELLYKRWETDVVAEQSSETRTR